MNTSDLRKIIREEITGVLKEMIEPSEFLKKNFPEVIEYESNRRMSDLNWKVITNDRWTDDRAVYFQSKAGYSPMGYGGPYKFEEEILPDGKFKYTWHCASSSG